MTYTTIVRAPRNKENPYFMFRRDTAQDSHLSFDARGVLAYLLSKPQDWELTPADLMREGDIGRDKTNRILSELEAHGYLVREQGHDEKGRFTGVRHVLHEQPVTEKPCTDKPSTEKPHTGEPCTANPHHTNKEILQSTDIYKTGESTKTDSMELDAQSAVEGGDAGAEPPDGDQHGGDSELTALQAWQARGFDVGQQAFWWYEDGNKFVPGTIVRFTRCYCYFEATDKHGNTHTIRRGPANCSVDGKTDTWQTVDDLDPLLQVIAIHSYSMQGDQGVSGDRMKVLNAHRKELRIRFGTNGSMVDAEELQAVYDYCKRIDRIAPKKRGAIGDLVDEYRSSVHSPHARPTNVAPRPDVNCAVCDGLGYVIDAHTDEQAACPACLAAAAEVPHV